MKPISIAIATLFLALVGGCKIRMEVPEGGFIRTESGAYRCNAGESCDIEVVDIHFDEVFVAEAAPGYTFTGWARIDRGLCGGKAAPCELYTRGFDQNEALLAFLEAPDEVFYLIPVFEPTVTDAFDPAVITGNDFLVRDAGFTFTFRFNEDGTYSFAAPPLFASGRYEFRAKNTVIFFSEMANTNKSGLTGYAVFEGFDTERNGYLVCEVTDQAVGSVSQAQDICENGAAGNIDPPVRYFYAIKD